MAKVVYELWDTKSTNVLGVYDTVPQALDVVRAMVERSGSSAAYALALESADYEGVGDVIAEGPALLDLAFRAGKSADLPSGAAR